MIIFNILSILFAISQMQILTHSGEIKLPLRIKILGKFLELIFNPIRLFKKPKESFGGRLTKCFERLGPIYIKFGQTLSTRPDLIGADVAKDLQYLQDNLSPFSVEIVKQKIHASTGKKIEEIFNFFDESPIAAASISQVHKAQLTTGEDVAVKILRPNIHIKYNNDLKLLNFIAKLIGKLIKKMKRLRLIEIIDIFKKTMKIELDLRLEASAASEMRDNFLDDPNIYIPKIYWSLTSEHILVMEWVDGISIYNTLKLKEEGLKPSEISKNIAIMFFNQAYRDGFFHADLHPGNILVKKNGNIVLLDFGIMGRLTETDRIAVAEILAAFLQQDYKLVADIHLRVGYVPKNTNADFFAQSCRAVGEPIIGLPIKDISIGKLLAQLFKITEDFGMETQPQLLLLQKTMVVVEGIGQSLNPEINMWELARPWIKKWGAKNLSPEAKILRLVQRLVKEFLDENYNKYEYKKSMGRNELT